MCRALMPCLLVLPYRAHGSCCGVPWGRLAPAGCSLRACRRGIHPTDTDGPCLEQLPGGNALTAVVCAVCQRPWGLGAAPHGVLGALPSPLCVSLGAEGTRGWQQPRVVACLPAAPRLGCGLLHPVGSCAWLVLHRQEDLALLKETKATGKPVSLRSPCFNSWGFKK